MIDCPYYIPPRIYIDPRTGVDYEGSAMCSLCDRYCLKEYGQECVEYDLLQ